MTGTTHQGSSHRFRGKMLPEAHAIKNRCSRHAPCGKVEAFAFISQFGSLTITNILDIVHCFALPAFVNTHAVLLAFVSAPFTQAAGYPDQPQAGASGVSPARLLSVAPCLRAGSSRVLGFGARLRPAEGKTVADVGTLRTGYYGAREFEPPKEHQGIGSRRFGTSAEVPVPCINKCCQSKSKLEILFGFNHVFAKCLAHTLCPGHPGSQTDCLTCLTLHMGSNGLYGVGS